MLPSYPRPATAPIGASDRAVAKAGEIVTCEQGHPVLRVIADIQERTRLSAKNFASLEEPALPLNALAGSVAPRCPTCGGAAFRTNGVATQVCVGGDWRP